MHDVNAWKGGLHVKSGVSANICASRDSHSSIRCHTLRIRKRASLIDAGAADDHRGEPLYLQKQGIDPCLKHKSSPRDSDWTPKAAVPVHANRWQVSSEFGCRCCGKRVRGGLSDVYAFNDMDGCVHKCPLFCYSRPRDRPLGFLRLPCTRPIAAFW